MDWYYAINGERKGPVSVDSIKALLGAGGLSKTDLVWNESMGEKWAKIADVPALGGLQSAQDDPKAKHLFMEKMKERQELVKRERRGKIIAAVIAIACVALVAGGATAFVLSKPWRQWGISSSHPVGTLAKLEARLIGEYQMQKEVLK